MLEYRNDVMRCWLLLAERQNRKLLEQLEEQKKRLRMQTQQNTAAGTTTGYSYTNAQCYGQFGELKNW